MDAREPTPQLAERLTEREKQALRAWLEHKTAKEIAIDLGVSHYAVEKRLKMARTKLGVNSSLEAARILAEFEGYEQPVAQPPEFTVPAAKPQKWFIKPLMLGVSTMTIVAAALLAIALQSGATSEDFVIDEEFTRPGESEIVHQPASDERVDTYLQTTFLRLDRDASGFVERDEGPASIVLQPSASGNAGGDPQAAAQTLYGEDAWQRYLLDNKDDGDGRVSLTEFSSALKPAVMRLGIPVIAPDRIPLPVSGEDMQIAQAMPATRTGNDNLRELQPGFRAASMCETNLFLRGGFENLDADQSGMLEPVEVSVLEPKNEFRDRNIGPAPAEGEVDQPAIDKWVPMLDNDNDGLINSQEYISYMMPWMLLNGLPEQWEIPQPNACET